MFPFDDVIMLLNGGHLDGDSLCKLFRIPCKENQSGVARVMHSIDETDASSSKGVFIYTERKLSLISLYQSGTRTLQCRHNERDSVSNHRRLDCLFNRLFRRRSKNPSKLRVTGLCQRNPPVTSEFPSQRSSNEENVSIWWHHGFQNTYSFLKRHSLTLIFFSLSGKTSYRKISWSLEAARIVFRHFQLLWKLTGTSAAALPRCC